MSRSENRRQRWMRLVPDAPWKAKHPVSAESNFFWLFSVTLRSVLLRTSQKTRPGRCPEAGFSSL